MIWISMDHNSNNGSFPPLPGPSFARPRRSSRKPKQRASVTLKTSVEDDLEGFPKMKVPNNGSFIKENPSIKGRCRGSTISGNLHNMRVSQKWGGTSSWMVYD